MGSTLVDASPVGEDRRATDGSLRHRILTLESVTVVVTAGLAVLVGHDGAAERRLLRVVVVLAIGTACIVIMVRTTNDRTRGRTAVPVGIFVLAVGFGFVPHLVKADDIVLGVVAALEVVLGMVLAIGGWAVATRGRGWLLRGLSAAFIALLAIATSYVIAIPVAATNVPTSAIDGTPADVGLAFETVDLVSPEGVQLAGWYVPSTNGAAVALLHGAGSTRSNVLAQAAVVARHGFGVLLLDARGHGESEGRAMDFGWHGDDDIAAATTFLADRPDVEQDRIGVIGMSMGGEEAIGATAENPLVRAVVAEGATARSAADEAWLSDEYGLRGALQEQVEKVQDLVTDVLTDASAPISNHDAVARSSDVVYLLIAAGTVPEEEQSARYVEAADPERVAVWVVPGAGHTDGLGVAREEWEARVIAFLDAALGAR